jgi:hypothetical protein
MVLVVHLFFFLVDIELRGSLGSDVEGVLVHLVGMNHT